MPLKLAANLTMLFPETKTMSERFERARKSGFKYVESAFLFEPKERMKEAKQASGLEHVLMNGNPGKFFCIFIS
jgi:hydroxypyruvate isomerase